MVSFILVYVHKVTVAGSSPSLSLSGTSSCRGCSVGDFWYLLFPYTVVCTSMRNLLGLHKVRSKRLKVKWVTKRRGRGFNGSGQAKIDAFTFLPLFLCVQFVTHLENQFQLQVRAIRTSYAASLRGSLKRLLGSLGYALHDAQVKQDLKIKQLREEACLLTRLKKQAHNLR